MGKLKFLAVLIALAFLASSCHRTGVEDHVKYYLLEDSTLRLSADEAWAAFKASKFKQQTTHSFNPGFTTSFYWLVAEQTSATSEDDLLEIGTSQINEIHFYEIADDKPVLKNITGDYHPFESRPISSLDFTFPLSKQTRHYLLRIDKKNESLQLTFLTKPYSEYFLTASESSMVVGTMSGAICIMLVFGLFLFIITRERIYIFYMLYVAAGWLYVLANLGYGYKYFWPDNPWFASRARPVFSLLTLAFSLQFIEYYVGKVTSRYLNYIFKALTYVAYVLAVIFLIPTVDSKATTFGYYVQAMLPALSVIYIVSLLTVLGQQIYNRNRMAIFFLVSIAPIVLFSALQITYYAGGVDFSGSFLQHYGQATGYVMEAVILTFGLAYRFNNYRLEKEQLLVNLNRQQVRYAKAIISTQENERRQLADQLHDVAGSLLSAARLNLSAVREKNYITNEDAQQKLASAEYAVSDISTILRNMSHAISPVMLDKVGFRQAVEKIVGIFNTSGKIKFELEILGFETENPEMYEKYSVLYGILYELMNNIVKHAGATHALIQLIEHEDSIVLLVEDNGIGLAEKDSQKSISQGLTAIHSKVHYLGGTVIMEDAHPHGLIVTIEILKGNDDKNHTG